MTAHRITLRLCASTVFGRAAFGHQATCDCGWLGGGWLTKREAEAEGRRHNRAGAFDQRRQARAWTLSGMAARAVQRVARTFDPDAQGCRTALRMATRVLGSAQDRAQAHAVREDLAKGARSGLRIAAGIEVFSRARDKRAGRLRARALAAHRAEDRDGWPTFGGPALA